MRSVSVRLDDLRTMILNLGFVGENEHTRVLIDAKKMFDQYPTASASLTVSPPHGAAYPAVIERDGDLISWDVTDSDLINEGAGEFQLAFTVDEVVAKSYIGRFRVSRSIIPTGEIPEPIDDFLTRAGAALTAIPETIDEALGEVTAEAETLAAGSDATALYNNALKQFTFGIPRGADGQAGAPGRDGTDGRDGQDGAPGADGFSPSASVTKSGSTATITITDKTGTTTAQISDGESGASVIDDNAGVGDTDKVWSADKTATENGNLLSAFNALELSDNLLFSEMQGTSTTVTMDSNGNPTSIVHTANSETVRTDAFVWGTGTVTETRTLANGKYITITTNLTTLAQTISAVQEVA